MFSTEDNQKNRINLCQDFERVGCFQFKVLELKTTEDTDEFGENLPQETVRELFNFEFNLNLPSRDDEMDETFAFN